ncbi:hypothetical protein CRUP_034568, partial [Coryphaenoides rupestris]
MHPSSRDPAPQEAVDRLNRQNAERSHGNEETEAQGGGGGGGGGGQAVLSILSEPQTQPAAPSEDEEGEDSKESAGEEEEEEVSSESGESEVEVEVEVEAEPVVERRTEVDEVQSGPSEAPRVLPEVPAGCCLSASVSPFTRSSLTSRGRFGQVHKCLENSSGLTLAAKIIKARSQKEKDVVRNEIQVMNQLNHANLIQLHAAYESRNDIVLVMEYVDGGELFDRIIDENSTLSELDTVLFVRQICDGLQYMHKMYILHLDLKTLNNILACQWNFEEDEFLDVSEEAKDFITRLLVKSKSWRMSATASLKHPWLCDRGLHYRLQHKVGSYSSLQHK